MMTELTEHAIKESYLSSLKGSFNYTFKPGADVLAITTTVQIVPEPARKIFIVLLVENQKTIFTERFEDLDAAIKVFIEQYYFYQRKKMLNKEEKPTWMMNNLVAVDKGALKMVENIMRRNNKDEPMDAILETYTEIEDVLKWFAENKPELYMKYVTASIFSLIYSERFRSDIVSLT